MCKQNSNGNQIEMHHSDRNEKIIIFQQTQKHIEHTEYYITDWISLDVGALSLTLALSLCLAEAPADGRKLNRKWAPGPTFSLFVVDV